MAVHQLLCVHVLDVDAWSTNHDVTFTDMFLIFGLMKVSSLNGKVVKVMKAAHLILKDQYMMMKKEVMTLIVELRWLER
jgi:hypothetical protein